MGAATIADLMQGKDILRVLPLLVARTYVLRYCVVACYCWMLFDWVLTAKAEVRWIWSKKWDSGKVVYLFLRWYSLAFETYHMVSLSRHWDNQDFCRSHWWIVGVGSLVLIFIVEIVLQGRVYAMYRCDQRLLGLNFLLFLAAIGSTGAIFAQQLPFILTVQAPAPLTGCWGVVQSEVWMMWFPCFLMEVWLWLLVIYKARNHAKRFAVDERKAVLTLLIRDSVAWFAVMSMFMCWNMLAFRFAEDGWNFLGVPFLHTAASIGGSRMILNMREAYYTDNVRSIRPQAGALGIAYDLGALGYVQESRRYTMGPGKRASIDVSKSSDYHTDDSSMVMELGERISRDPALESGRKTTSLELMVGPQQKIDITVMVETQVTSVE